MANRPDRIAGRIGRTMTPRQATLITVVLAVVLGISGAQSTRQAFAQADDVLDQLAVDPGEDFVFRLTGACAGVWQSLLNGACVHADFASSSGDSGFTDGNETYDPQYQEEIATGPGKLPAYCAASSGDPSWRVIYAYDRGRESRYLELRSQLRDATERADYWIWRSAKLTGGSAHLRLTCADDGAIQTSSEDLAGSNAYSFGDIIKALRNRGFNDRTRKYLVYADVTIAGVCGNGEVHADDNRLKAENRNNSGNQYAAVYLRTSGCEDQRALIAMHEVAHAMGAVQKSAPNHNDPNSLNQGSTWHTRDQYDRMSYGPNLIYPAACADVALEKRYDCRGDDYFHTDPASGSYLRNKWNTARNDFLKGGER